MAKKIVSIIAAMDKNGVIGHKGEIPWHLSGDIKMFAKMTKGHPVIMGRKTYESIIKKLGHPLIGRMNIVLTNQKKYSAESIVANSLTEALCLAERCKDPDEVFIIGGEKVYKDFLPYAQKMYLTKIQASFCGDSFFPVFNEQEWEVIQGETQFENGIYFTFFVYKKRLLDNF